MLVLLYAILQGGGIALSRIILGLPYCLQARSMSFTFTLILAHNRPSWHFT